MSYLIHALALLLRAAGWLMLAFILLLLLNRGLAYFEDAGSYPLTARLIQAGATLEKPALDTLRRSVPTRFRGTDIAPWMLLAGLWLAWFALTEARRAVLGHAVNRRRPQRSKPAAAAAGEAVPARTLDREQLLEIYVQTKKSLERHKAWLAFLSLDVVNSTEMKIGEDPSVAERDFRQFRRFVERIVAPHALKAAWTPDGAMICFPNLRQAIEVAQAIILGLPEFNRKTKTISRDFAVRIGINAGEVLYDESVPMEQMSDLAIDIAGHMQKHCGANSICVAQQVLEKPLGSFEFRKTARQLDGLAFCEWDSSLPAVVPAPP
jgi:class 3 adenylate cyclase